MAEIRGQTGIEGPSGVTYTPLRIVQEDGTSWMGSPGAWGKVVWCTSHWIAVSQLLADGFGHSTGATRLWLINLATGAMCEVETVDRADLVPLSWSEGCLVYERVKRVGRVRCQAMVGGIDRAEP